MALSAVTGRAHPPKQTDQNLDLDPTFDWSQALAKLLSTYPYNQRGGIQQLARDLPVHPSTLAKWLARVHDLHNVAGVAPTLRNQRLIRDLTQAKVSHLP